MIVDYIFSKYSTDCNRVVYFHTFPSPLGKTIAVADDDYMYVVFFEGAKNIEKTVQTLSRELNCKFIEKKNVLLEKFEEQFMDYYSGKLKKFSLPVKTFGTDFQNTVWEKLMEIPYGSTVLYSDIAKSLGRTASYSRAVGNACGSNPLVLIVPCHRVVAVGSKGGYSNGVDRKDNLLQLENKFTN